ncbi:MAG: PHP domain-containing protein [Rectinemataceae bacterium]|nr:PHP domain-containing protein [Rectinemataceae bacterium]
MNNYHTHTFRCRHAEGDVVDYVAAAQKAGLEEIGFSDHCPHPDGRWRENRMDMADLPSYLEALAAARHASEGMRRPYPHLEFWRVAAEYGVTCLVGSDAHRPVDTAANLEDGLWIAHAFGLEVIPTLPQRPDLTGD